MATMKHYIMFFVVNIENLKNLKYNNRKSLSNIIIEKTLVLLFFVVSGRIKMKNYLKKKNKPRYLTLLV